MKIRYDGPHDRVITQAGGFDRGEAVDVEDERLAETLLTNAEFSEVKTKKAPAKKAAASAKDK